MRVSTGSLVVVLASAAPAQAASIYTINGVLTGVIVRGDGDASLPMEYGLREGANFSLQMSFNQTDASNFFSTQDFVISFDGISTTPQNFGKGIDKPLFASAYISAFGFGPYLGFDKKIVGGSFESHRRVLYMRDTIPGFSLRGVELTQELFSTFLPSTGKVGFIDHLFYANGGGLAPSLDVSADLILSSVTLSGTPLKFSVPEPATWASMVAGFGLLGGSLRRRRAGRAAAA